jgi:hypothetical protein
MAEFSLFGPGQHAELAQRFASSPSLRPASCRLAYLVEFLRHGPDGFLRNGHGTRAYVAIAGDAVVPLVVNDGEVDDCHLVSPRAHYILYMIDEMRKIEPRWLSSTLQKALAVVGAAVTAGGLNRLVSIDNWLFTTSPINPVTITELRTLTRGLLSAFPTHALVYRCIDPRQKRAWHYLSSCNYEFIMNRPVHEIDSARLALQNRYARRHTIRDQNLAKKGPLRARIDVPLSEAEAERVASLYQMLYMEKLSRLNAHYTPAYFTQAVASGLAKLVLYDRRDNGELAGFVTVFEDPGRFVYSLVGYDTSLDPKQFPVYRASYGTMTKVASDQGKLLFVSTGASSFKLKRGSYEWMEYEAFFVRHLPRKRQWAWRALARIINFAGTHLDSSQI